jgi:hypothetical protein
VADEAVLNIGQTGCAYWENNNKIIKLIILLEIIDRSVLKRQKYIII